MASISSRVVSIYNRKTSMRLAPAEWKAIELICQRENIPRKILFELIDLNRDEKFGLTSSIRLFVIIYYKNAMLKKPQAKPNDDTFVNPVFEAIKGIV